tara:strand:+ start:9273 stop:10484 length:1212 start_codon:yes stop_codon:yes gene_type:complete
MQAQNLSQIKRAPLAVVLNGIDSDDQEVSRRAGVRLVQEAKKYGINVRDYLNLSVDVHASNDEKAGKHFRLGNGQYMTGYQAAIVDLNLPFKNAFEEGITLQAAADTFSARPGSRALFPEVIDDMLQWNSRQDMFESTAPMVAQTRTISGTELITTAIFDDQGELNTSPLAELANIPMQTITSSDKSVRFFKHGSGIRTSYEFERRVSLDILTPYAARIARNKEISKVKMATNLLINGDGVHGAAEVVAASDYKNWDVTGGKSLKDNYVALADFFARRARKGTPVDIIVGNYDMWLEMFLMFLPTQPNGKSTAEVLQERGGPKVALMMDFLNGVNFHISSSAPTGKLICYSKADTLEELIEAGSVLSESETAIKNQSITYVKTENSGYRLVYGDTRVVFDTLA